MKFSSIYVLYWYDPREENQIRKHFPSTFVSCKQVWTLFFSLLNWFKILTMSDNMHGFFCRVTIFCRVIILVLLFCVFRVGNLKKIHPFPRLCNVLMNKLNINKVTGTYPVALLSKNFFLITFTLCNFSRMFPSVFVPQNYSTEYVIFKTKNNMCLFFKTHGKCSFWLIWLMYTY